MGAFIAEKQESASRLIRTVQSIVEIFIAEKEEYALQ
jgi:hypothetical protein